VQVDLFVLRCGPFHGWLLEIANVNTATMITRFGRGENECVRRFTRQKALAVSRVDRSARRGHKLKAVGTTALGARRRMTNESNAGSCRSGNCGTERNHPSTGPESGLRTRPQNVEFHLGFAYNSWRRARELSIQKISSTNLLKKYSFHLTRFLERILCGLKWSKVVGSRAE
jgi:hypothetical protein